MLGTRKSFLKASQVHEAVIKLEDQNKQPPKHVYWLRYAYQQGKQISQIIAYIWRWVEEKSPEYKEKQIIANQLKEYFAHPTKENEHPMQNLKKLFAADARQPNSSPEAMFLSHVFNPISEEMIFPIFDEFELGEKFPELGYLFEINVNSFEGDLQDATVNDLQMLKWIIPYPPRPHIGEVTVTLPELDEWVNNRAPNQYIPQSPYIPSSSC